MYRHTTDLSLGTITHSSIRIIGIESMCAQESGESRIICLGGPEGSSRRLELQRGNSVGQTELKLSPCSVNSLLYKRGWNVNTFCGNGWRWYVSSSSMSLTISYFIN